MRGKLQLECLLDGIYEPIYNFPMNAELSLALDAFAHLSPAERRAFFSVVTRPQAEAEDWTDEDYSALAAQTFSRLDAEEEENAAG